MTAKRSTFLVLALAGAICVTGCAKVKEYDPASPALGPGALVGNDGPLNDGNFPGGDDTLPAPREIPPPDDSRPPDCDGDCERFCAQAGLQNPVNRGLCQSLWGVGLAHRPVEHAEACRRLFIDLLGAVPSADEMAATCTGGWGATVRRMIADERFVFVQQRRMADELLYANELVSLQAIWDMDGLTAKLYRGHVPWDLFAAVTSAHPVLTRRHADARDTVEALFRHFLGRPPFENERADMARLYNVWHHGYYDHPQLGLRLPDAYLRYPCLTEDGEVDKDRKGECTSVLWGYEELIFQPDFRAFHDPRARGLVMWSGLMKPEEWQRAQVPGRILARDLAFWEHAVDRVLRQYLGYDLSSVVPEVRVELVRYLLEHQGDIRAVHFAIATSAAYLQSHAGEGSAAYRWTWGPLKQVDAEVWIDSVSRRAGISPGGCDHRLSQPAAALRSGSLSAYRTLLHSRWPLTEEGRVDMRYADVARTLGGCPENVVGGRFHVTSILTTATQLGFVESLCNPALDPRESGNAAPAAALLPQGMDPRRAVDPQVARDIAAFQYRQLVGHVPDESELNQAAAAGETCALTRCAAEEFARPLCFALLSSAELLFH